jgi:DNA modification methylase
LILGAPIVRYVDITDVVVPAERQRKHFEPEAQGELIGSIREFGIMQPIVCREVGGEIQLVAGERRLRAMRDLMMIGDQIMYGGLLCQPGQIPINMIGEIGEAVAFELELEENIRRKDLTWQERAEALARLHKYRSDNSPTEQTFAQTAEEVFGRGDGSFSTAVSRSVAVAKHLDNPEVAKAKNVDEAFKILKRAENRTANAEHAAIIGSTFSRNAHELVQADCLAYMAESPPARFDCILTDPPYGIGADQFGDSGGLALEGSHNYEDSEGATKVLLAAAVPLFARVAKPAAHLYMFCDVDHFAWLRELVRRNGWTPFRTPLIWHKPNTGRVPLPTLGPRRQYECILYAYRGDKPVTAIYSDVLSVAADENLGHAAQKPVELYRQLLQRSCVAGDTVYDAFCGSGTIFPAAHSMLLRATGTELSASAYGLAAKRLEEL